MDRKSLLDALLPEVRAAGEVILEIYATDFAVRGKEDASPVTVADERAEVVLTKALARITPDIPVVAEEAVAVAGRLSVTLVPEMAVIVTAMGWTPGGVGATGIPGPET